MRARTSRLALAGLAVAAMTAALPAHADGGEAGASQGYAGAIAGHDESYDANTTNPTAFAIDGACTFAGVLTPPVPEAKLIIEFGGYVHATGTGGANATTPIFTDVYCTIDNLQAGGSNSMTASLRTNGSASVIASSTALATSGDKEWPVLPVRVCVRGEAHFGPFNPVTVVLNRRCQSINLPI